MTKQKKSKSVNAILSVLMISQDEQLLDEKSRVFERVSAYRRVVDSLYVIVLTKDHSKHKIELDNLKIIPVYYRGYLTAFWGLLRASFTISNITLVTSDCFERGLVAYVYARLKKIRLEVQVHGDTFSPFYATSLKKKIRLKLATFLIRRADHIRVVSKKIALNLPSTSAKITILPVFVDIKKHPKRNIFEKKLDILFVGRLELEKNPMLAIRVMSILSTKGIPATLSVVGDGTIRQKMEQEVKESNLENHIKFYGWQKNPAMFYEKSNVFLQTSWYEGCSLALIEALSFGLVAVSTNVGAIGHEISGNVVLKAEPGDAYTLAKKIESLYKVPDLGRLLSIEGQNSIKSFPDFPTYLDQLQQSWVNAISR